MGSNKGLADKILASAEIESIQIQLNTRIDAWADITNIAKQFLSLADDEIAQDHNQAQE